MFFEDHSTAKLGVAYGGSAKTPQAWAEHFGRKVIDALIEGEKSPEVIGAYGRLAGSFARIALEDRAVVDEGCEVIRGAFGERNSQVHPVMRDIVNLTSALYGVPVPGGEK